MSAVKTRVYSSFDESEATLLHDFKKEVFYFTGEDLKNHNFWQQFYNLFFIYHYDIGDGVTLSQKRELEAGSIKLFAPSVFSRMKGEDLFTGDKLSFSEDEEKIVYFMQINNAKFRKPVVPGDQLFMEMELVQKKSKIIIITGKAYVNEVLVAEADFMAGIVDKPKVNTSSETK